MSETYRCIDAFAFRDHIYPGGIVVDEGDPILTTHTAHFARVNQPAASAASETASAAPSEHRTPATAPPKTKVDATPKAKTPAATSKDNANG